jgi:hypothetical protein
MKMFNLSKSGLGAVMAALTASWYFVWSMPGASDAIASACSIACMP